MHRVILINRKSSPSRKELVTNERRVGEMIFADFPSLDFAGYVIPEGTFKKAANWIIPEKIFDRFLSFVESVESNDYDIWVMKPGNLPHGGFGEIRAF